MKRILTALALACAAVSSFGATLNPVQLLNPAGSSSGQAIVSTGASTAPAWGNVTATSLAPQAANTVIGNATGSSASPTAITVTGCNGAAQALQWTNGSGFGCNSAVATSGSNSNITALSGLTTALSVAQGGTGATSAAAALTSLGAAPIASPTFTGTVTTAALNAAGNDALFYQTTNALSVPNGTATTVTTWTKVSDRVNANFNASTGTFTAPATGQYLVSVGLAFSSGMTGGSTISASVRIVANGVTLAGAPVQVPATTTTAIGVTATALASLTAGQTIVIQAFQNSGAAVTLAVGSAYNNYVSIVRVP